MTPDHLAAINALERCLDVLRIVNCRLDIEKQEAKARGERCYILGAMHQEILVSMARASEILNGPRVAPRRITIEYDTLPCMPQEGAGGYESAELEIPTPSKG